MYSVSIKTDKAWQDILASLNKKDELLMKHMNIALLKSLALVRTNVLQSGKVPYKTGDLRRSITTAIHGLSVDQLRGQVGTNLPYAAIHEFGGTYTFTRSSAFGRPTKPFTYQATYKARRYLRDPFAASLPEVNKIFMEELGKVVSFRRGK